LDFYGPGTVPGFSKGSDRVGLSALFGFHRNGPLWSKDDRIVVCQRIWIGLYIGTENYEAYCIGLDRTSSYATGYRIEESRS
jgi:hypothetical protein